VLSWNGFTNSVQTYCGLEIDIIAIRPSNSWIHRVDEVAGTAVGAAIDDTDILAP
jgi:hypothetical protein